MHAGDFVGDFELLSELGHGGFASVWLARDHRGKKVAVKILRPDLVRDPPDLGQGPSIPERFLAEARLLRDLKHPGVVGIRGLVQEPETDTVAYAMELLVGNDLSACEHLLDLATLLKLLAKVADILSYLHENGIIHRDIKQANIFITAASDENDGLHKVKLLDFGVAKELRANAVLNNTEAGTYLGSVSSMAPETFTRWDSNAPALSGCVDQWGLGVTLYQCLSGEFPFRGDAITDLIEHIEHYAPAPLALLPRFGLESAPAEVVEILNRCLAKQPENRYPNMITLAGALRLASRAVDTRAPTEEGPVDPRLLDLRAEAITRVLHRPDEDDTDADVVPRGETETEMMPKPRVQNLAGREAPRAPRIHTAEARLIDRTVTHDISKRSGISFKELPYVIALTLLTGLVAGWFLRG